MCKNSGGGSESKPEEEKSTENWWDLGSPLYDSHELVSISHLIERHLMALPHSFGSWSRRLSRKFSSVDVGRLITTAGNVVVPVDGGGGKVTERMTATKKRKSGAGCFAFIPSGLRLRKKS